MLFLLTGANKQLTAWITELVTGAPVGQASVSAWNKKKETNNQGLCTIGEQGDGNDEGNAVLIVEKGGDQCILTDIRLYASFSNAYIFHVFNDRGLYKPKEEVHIKGYARLLEIKGDAKLPTYGKGIISYTVCDPRGQELQQSKVELNEYGAFDIKFTLPDNINLGKSECLLLPYLYRQLTFEYKLLNVSYHY